jgi:hypothetical protein
MEFERYGIQRFSGNETPIFHCAEREETEANGGHRSDRTLNRTSGQCQRVARGAARVSNRSVRRLTGPAHSVNMVWSSFSEEPTGRGGESGHDRPDASGHGGCLLDSNRTLGVMRPVSSAARPVGASRAQALCDRRVRSIQAARPVTLVCERVLLSDCYDRMNKIQSETRGVHRGGHGGATGRCACLVRPDQRIRSPRVWLFREPTTLFFRGLL